MALVSILKDVHPLRQILEHLTWLQCYPLCFDSQGQTGINQHQNEMRSQIGSFFSRPQSTNTFIV
jgi:hypothetical protein